MIGLKTSIKYENSHCFRENHLSFPSNLHCTRASAWLGLAVSSNMDLGSVHIRNYVKKTPYVLILYKFIHRIQRYG
jgi:hypothetical protein